MRTLFSAFCLLFLGFSCQRPHSEGTSKDYRKHGDTIIVVENSPLAEKIETTAAGKETYSKEISTAAIVRAIPTAFAHIAPPFSGRVMKSHFKLGQKVAINTPLFEISSPQFMEAQKDFFQSKSNYKLALQALNRQQDLIENGVGTKRELEEAQNSLELALQEYQNFSEVIRAYNANPERIQLGQHFIVRAPIAGEVIENNVVVGQFLKEDADPVAIVADLSKIWIVGQVKEMDIRHIHKNDEVDISVGAYPEVNINGRIFHIQEMINEDTRSLEVLIESDNPSSTLKHGMFVTANFKNQAVEKIMLPTKAVLQEEESAYVFVQGPENTYFKRTIKTGGSQNGKIVVESGIEQGEIIVSAGGYFLLNAH